MADSTVAHRHHAHRAPSWAVLELRKRLRDNSPLPSKFCNWGSPRSQSLSFVLLIGWIGHHCELNLRPRRASPLFSLCSLLHLPLNSPAQTQEEPPFKQAQQARQVERDKWRLDQVGISALSSPAQADEWPLLQGRGGERRWWGGQWLSPKFSQEGTLSSAKLLGRYREGKVFLYLLRVPGWVWKLNRQRQINRRKVWHFIEFLHLHGSLHKRVKTWRSDQSRKLLYHLDKETINLWGIDKTKEFGLGVVNGEEVTRKIKVSLTRCVRTDFSAPQFPVSGKVFPSPGTGRAPFTGEFYDLFQGRRVGEGGGRSALPASAIKKQIPQLKIFNNKMPYFGVACPERHHRNLRRETGSQIQLACCLLCLQARVCLERSWYVKISSADW